MGQGNRFQFKFWLDCSKDDELLVAETIDELKRQRSFSATVRDGIMLINELRQGKTDLLLKLFPWIVEALRPTAGESDANTDDLKHEIQALREAVLAQGGNGYLMAPPPKRRADTDALPEIVVKKNTSTDAAANFLASLAALGQ